MPSGVITPITKAKSDQNEPKENKYWQYNRPSSLLKKGKNVIAVEVHQYSETSDDLGFDLALLAHLKPCNTPSNLSIVALNSNAVSLIWDSTGANNYIVEYKTIDGNIFSESTSQNFITLDSLQSAQLYSVRIKSNCGYQLSEFSPSLSFVTETIAVLSDTIVQSGENWSYSDQGNINDTNWTFLSYNDSSWWQGSAQLGYGDNDESTVIGFGPDSSNKYITSYFRKKVSLSTITHITSFNIDILYDDGAIVYVNGNEVIRANMPVGVIDYSTLSSTSLGEPEEYSWSTYSIPTSYLQVGENIIAVEVHQSSSNSSDLSFDLRALVEVNNLNEINRTPYLQSISNHSVQVLYTTALHCDGKIYYGTNMDYGMISEITSDTTTHNITLQNLSPNTRYYYAIAADQQLLSGGQTYYFDTAPIDSSSEPFRFWVTGDFGNGSLEQEQVRDSYLNYSQNQKADFWIWLGDNAYDYGTSQEFDNNVFAVYPEILKNTPVYPCLGNHDYADIGYLSAEALTDTFPYFDLFEVPDSAQAGGYPSNTEKYYSFNYGNAHFIVLDSYGSYNDSNSTMYNWLQNDLAQNTLPWLVCYFHHPAYTMGSHNSDTEIESYSIRENIIPLLESYDVDLVLSGHSHNYERSYLTHGHYGLENSLLPSMLVDTSDGLSPYYTKALSGLSQGAIYSVVGNSGTGGATSLQSSWPHDIMHSYLNGLYGSMIVDIHGDTLLASYLTSGGLLYDQFKIVKSVNTRMFDQSKSNSFSSEFILSAFPNPAQHSFNVGNNEGKLQILDIQGQIVFTKEFVSKNESIQISQLSNGFYLIIMESEGKLLRNILEINR